MLVTVETAIKNYKHQIISKAKKTGIWENFGQAGVGILEDTYREHQYLNDGVWDKIREFDNWCQTYKGE